jgi:7,8-dihydropterin-6-yl-methyl-4-(beta-D-ribofuranosyl)aminobenzene 5'-phosphate synthase
MEETDLTESGNLNDRPPRLAILVENRVYRRGLFAEHGFAALVETCRGTVLFDTGQTGLAWKNAHELGIDLSSVSALVLSHGHYDHTGGLPALLELVGEIKLYAHPQAFAARYADLGGGELIEVGPPMGIEELRGRGIDVVLSKGPEEIVDGVMTTGEISRRVAGRTTDNAMKLCAFRDGQYVPDHFIDDQALIIETGEGLCLLLGCAHAGVENTLATAADVAGSQTIRAVVGGMHLGGASEGELHSVAEALRRYQVRRIFPAHCTGDEATWHLRAEFGEAVTPCSSGMIIRLFR